MDSHIGDKGGMAKSDIRHSTFRGILDEKKEDESVQRSETMKAKNKRKYFNWQCLSTSHHHEKDW
ncbi:CLUMA_CG020482, isoform A [Clunio marinus]|uniref:CLUMA_CG020482, isoform A n=1 Tax=Clunio marinus TaxID=568069 RepID=A0A1J1J532_9DIPT|nr:CLUMA_CG020482, isoform A [Clunio marinus]